MSVLSRVSIINKNDKLREEAQRKSVEATAGSYVSIYIAVAVTGAGLAGCLVLAFFLVCASITGPITRMTQTMSMLAAARRPSPVPPLSPRAPPSPAAQEREVSG